MSWQLIMLGQNLLAALFAVNSRYIAQKYKRAALPFNLVGYFTIAISGILYALTDLQRLNVSSFLHFFWYFIFAGIFFAVTNILSFVVFQYVDAAIASLLSTLNIIAAAVLSTILIGEGLSIRQAIGAFILLLGMEIVLSINFSRKEHKRIWEAVILSVTASIFFALAVTTEKYLLNRVTLTTYLAFGWSFQFLGVGIICLIFARRVKANFALLQSLNFYRSVLPASILRMVGGLLFIISLKLANNLSVISVLSGLKVIMAALLAAYVLHENDYLPRKIEAAVIACVGIAVIYWH